MKVTEKMALDVEVAAPDDTIQTAALMMADTGAGVLPVCDGKRLVGMVTDRDIAGRAVAQGKAPGDCCVRDVMTGEVNYVFDNEEVSGLAGKMAQWQVHRLPVLNKKKKLIGIVSLGDLALESQDPGQRRGRWQASSSRPTNTGNSRRRMLPENHSRAAAVHDPVAAAKSARLRHVSDDGPGITRHRARSGFDYRDIDGSLISDIETLRRIRALAIPPAWTEVWICPHAQGHIQATGRDARGRKQYRYHPRWRETRDETKFNRMVMFSRALPRIRQRVEADLSGRGLTRERVLAAIVRLLELTLFRIGNSEYSKANHSFGLTTLRDRHAVIDGDTLRLSFRGKSGVRHEGYITDRRVARIVKNCRDLPGYELFQYVDEDGERHIVDSADVNAYLREISGEEITAKDFRTWAGTYLAALALQQVEAFDGEAKRKSAIVRAIEEVANHLGNTPAVCRKCYVHPAIFDGYLSGRLSQMLERRIRRYQERNIAAMSAEEAAVAAFLRLHLARAARAATTPTHAAAE